MSIDDTLKRERQIMQAVRDRNAGLETPTVTFYYRIADGWEMEQARIRRKKNRQVTA